MKVRLRNVDNFELARRIRRGDREARAEMIEANIPLVYYFAEGYLRGRSKKSSAVFDDLIGYGCVGLIEAVDEFDPEIGSQFSTFARYRILRYFLIATWEVGNLIHVPINYTSTKYRARQKQEYVEASDRAKFHTSKIREDMKVAEIDPSEDASRLELARVLRECVGNLRPRERKAIRMYHLSANGSCSRKDLAIRLGCSVQALNALLLRARAKLGKSERLCAAI